MVLAIISIARGLGFKLVAERVETATQAHYLEQSGCTNMQGYYYYPPLPCGQFIELLREKRTISA